MKIIFSGGYTLGPVTPLLAVYDILKEKYPQAEFLWLGTKNGPERALLEEKGIKFSVLPAGKFRRYFSLWNVVDLAMMIWGFFKSLKIMWKQSPDLCVSAGGFVSVPVHWSAWLFNIPTWVHQQDVEVGLANRLMAPFAKVITTALEKNLKNFSTKKTVWLGNPVRREILTSAKDSAFRRFNLRPDLPVIFAMGGGTGSMRINQLIVQSIQHLKGLCQVIHLSGKERPQELVERALSLFSDFYQVHKFFTAEMAEAYASADIIISRGGFGSLSEIAALGKPAIIIPKPGHQEENVKFLAKAGAIILVDERAADGNYLAKTIKELLADSIKQKQLTAQLKKMMPIAEKDKVLQVMEKMLEC